MLFQSTLPVGGATRLSTSRASGRPFQSTLPVGGATLIFRCILQAGIFQSTLPVGGATVSDCRLFQRIVISIHAPRGGSDSSLETDLPGQNHFNPRSPWGERPRKNQLRNHRRNFNPRSPWGERPAVRCDMGGGDTISIHAPRGGSDFTGGILEYR